MTPFDADVTEAEKSIENKDSEKEPAAHRYLKNAADVKSPAHLPQVRSYTPLKIYECKRQRQ